MPVKSTTMNQGELARALRRAGADDFAPAAKRAAQTGTRSVAPAVVPRAQGGVARKDVPVATVGIASSSAGAALTASTLAPSRSGKGAGAMRHDVEQALDRARAPDAAVAIKVYDPKGKVERPLERALVHVGRLHTALVGKPVEQLLDWKTSNDVRKPLFALQGLLRVYEGGKKMEKALERVKAFEDALGGYDYALTMQKLGVEKNLDPRARHVLDEHVVTAHEAAVQILADGWLPEGADGSQGAKRLDKLVEAFVDRDLGKEKKDAGNLRDLLAEKLEDAADKSRDLDMSELESGLHELRRAIRWIPISFMALDGLVVLDDRPGPIAAFEALKNDPIAQSPYSKLPPPGGDTQRISVPQSLFLALSKAINDLGTLKDEGQVVHGFAEALVESGAHKDLPSALAAAEKVVGEPGRLQRITRDAESARKALVKSGLLDAIKDAVAG